MVVYVEADGSDDEGGVYMRVDDVRPIPFDTPKSTSPEGLEPMPEGEDSDFWWQDDWQVDVDAIDVHQFGLGGHTVPMTGIGDMEPDAMVAACEALLDYVRAV
jgi:hypothetical protein